MRVASLERQLIRKWRAFHSLTLARLGGAIRPKKKSVARMSEIETRDNTMGVAEILEVIHAFVRLGKPIGPSGASDQERLAIFFAGPMEETVSEDADRVLIAVTALHARIAQRAGPKE